MTSVAQIERSSVRIAKWANLWMAAAGVTAALVTNADALMLDGVFSGVNFIIAIVAQRVAASVAREPDAGRPFGYEIDESVYVMFRALILLGIIAVAAFMAVDKILAYASGAEIEPVRFDRIMVYVGLMVATSAGLAAVHHRNWRRTGKTSRLLAAERSAAIIDGALSAGAGIAFLVFGAMRGTALDVLVPVADSFVILILCLVMLPQPLGLFRGAFDEVLGVGLPPDERDRTFDCVRPVLDGMGLHLAEIAAIRTGRILSVLAYARSDTPVSGETLDQARERVAQQLHRLHGRARVEIVLTGETAAEPPE